MDYDEMEYGKGMKRKMKLKKMCPPKLVPKKTPKMV